MGRREKKAEATREAILNAAATIVGRYGYGKATIARIAAEAGVAHGLIYLYFENQQDLFDQLLPSLGESMLRYISEQISDARTTADRERLGLKANFEYLQKNPALHRILNEAAFFAPEAHHAYLRRMADGYTRSLQRGYDRDEVQGYERGELEVLAYMVIGAREFLLERYAAQDGSINDLPDEVKRTYLKAVARSLGLEPALIEPDAEERAEDARGAG